MAGDTSVDMMINVLPGTLTGIFALNAGLSSINQQFQNMTKAVDNHFGLVDAAIVSATALAVQFGKNAADAFGEYEQGMKIVQAVSGQTQSTIQELGNTANEFSVKYRMDIQELTDGLQTLGRAGLKSAQEQTEVLESGLQTAKLEGRDLNSVLEELIQNTTLLGGNLKSSNFGEQSEYVNDLLVATSMTAPINTHDVSETLKYSGGIAAAAGANIESEEGKKLLEDYMGAIAAFAQKGVKGSISGTALRAFFNKPATQDSSVKEGLSMIGLRPEFLWEDDGETMKPVSEQISLIQSQMDKKNISQMDRLQVWSKIVGGKMGQQMMKLDGSDIREVTKDIQAANSAENLATQSMQTYQSAMKQTGEAGQVAFRAFGEHVARFLTPIAKILTPILQALANPIISTGAFIGFLTLIGRAWLSIKKIFAGVRSEVGILKAEMQSLIMNQPARKQIMGGRLHGGGVVAGYQEYQATEKMKRDFYESRNQAQTTHTIVNETGLSASTSVRQVIGALQIIDGRLEYFRTIVTATNNRIKEELIKINSSIQGGVKTFGTSTSEVISKTSTQMQNQYNKVTTEISNSFGTKINANIRKSANQMRSEFRAVLNSLTYSPKIKATPIASANSAIRQKVDASSGVQSGSYFFLQDKNRYTKNLEAGFNKKLQDLEKRRANVMLSREVQGSVSKQEGKVDRLVNQRSNLQAELKQVAKDINTQNKIIDNANNKLRNHYQELSAQQQSKLYIQKENATEEKIRLEEKKKLLAEEIGYKQEEVSLHRKILSELEVLLAQINAERVSRLSGKGSTVKGNFGGLSRVFPGTAMSNIPKEFLPNYSVPNKSPTYSRWNLPPGYTPNTKSLENFTNEQKVQREKILAEREHIRTILAKNKANERNAVITEQYNARMSASLMNPATGAALNRMFGGSYTQESLLRAHLSTMAFNPAGGAMSWGMYTRGKDGGYNFGGMTDITVSALKALNAALIENTVALETSTAKTSTMAGGKQVGNAYAQTFSQSALAQKEAQHIGAQLEKMNLQGSYMGYAHIGYGSRSSAEEALNWARYRQSTDGRPRYVGANYADDNVRVNPNDIDSKNQAALKALIGEKLTKEERTLIGTQSGIKSKFSSIWNASGAKNITKGLKSSFKGLGGAVQKATGVLGGPFFAGMMAADIAMQIWNSAQQAFAKKVEEATQKIDEALQAQSDAENLFYKGKHEEGEREIQGWDDEHPDATSEEREQALLDAYGSIYDNSEKGLSSLEENTQQLAIATQEVKRASEVLGETYLDDSFFAGNGDWSDFLRGIYKGDQKVVFQGEGNQPGVGDFYSQQSEKHNLIVDKFGKLYSTASSSAGNYFDQESVVLDKSWQEDENYPWLKDFAPIISADIWRDKSTNAGLKMALGGAGYARLSDQISSTGGWDNTAWTRHGYNIMDKFGTETEQNKLQMGFKNYQKEFSKLSKQMRRFEKKTGATPLKALNHQYGKTGNMKKALKNLSVQDPKLVSYIKSLAIKTGMDEQQVLMAAQLQQLQEMEEIGKNQVAPQMQALVSDSYQMVAYGGQTLGQVSGSGSGAISAAQNARAIALLLNAQMEESLDKESFKDYQSHYKDPSQLKYQTPEQLAAAAAYAHNHPTKDNHWLVSLYDKKMATYAATNARLYNPELSGTEAAKMGQAFVDYYSGKDVSSAGIYDTLRKGGVGALQKQILNAYDAALDQEDSSGGSGGGSGSGSGNKDKDQGTKKERVDLVLCNKKEIPKLNVNLFKKPPSFTILNKNFKLRDIKVNTQDKPKAVLASIKNAIIDVQKRTDPKIIQDEDAVYDPAAATDGNNVPTGKTDSATDR